jgi:hypothetical protein
LKLHSVHRHGSPRLVGEPHHAYPAGSPREPAEECR